jgi:hypothetical protein
MRALKTVLVVMCLLAAPGVAFGQASISGVVKDASGAVLPGVTVEAASPVLIERVRSVTTNGAGQYLINDLRPGTYSVTFTLTGFNAVKREPIQLTGSLIASVDVELRVGAVNETITVTGEAPIVDLRSAKSEARISSETLSTVPTGRQYFNLIALVPGMVAQGTDVGGSTGPAFMNLRARGGANNEGQLQMNGFPVGYQGIGISYYVADMGAADEVAFGLSGGQGDSRASGPTMNVIGKQGGNTFAGSYFVNYSNGALEGSNFTDAHRALGMRVPNSLQKIWDTNANIGGPLVRDRLWFFSSVRHQGNRKLAADMFVNKNANDPTKWTYEPDLAHQARDTGTWMNATTRLTWQVSPRNKFSVFWDEQNICRQCTGDEGSATTSPEALTTNDGFPQRHVQALWTSPVNNRLLVDGGMSLNTVQWGGRPHDGVDTSLIRVQEQAGAIPGINYRSPNWTRPFGYTVTWRSTLSYVTGSHAAKVGYEGNYYGNRQMDHVNSQLLAYRLNNGVPNQLTMTLSSPRVRVAWTRDTSLYAQDQWSRGRLTLTGSVRYEYITSGFPEQRIEPSKFLAKAIVFPAQDSPVRQHDIGPRVGFALDVFGNKKTALKGSFGRYPADPSGSFLYANPYNPANLLATSTNRAWTDNDRDFVADCDLMNPLAQSPAATGSVDTCGAWSNLNFGNVQAPNEINDPKTLTGWNTRLQIWDLSLGVRQQIASRVGVEVEYVKRTFGNMKVTDNLAVGPADYDNYCVTAPVDSRLPSDVSGSQICDLWNIKPTKFGLTQNYVTFADNYGDLDRHYDGVNVNSTVRALGGINLQGGFSIGRSIYDDCDVTPKLDNPSKRFCRTVEPWNTDLNGLATYTVPKIGVQLSGTFTSKKYTGGSGNGNPVNNESLDANWVVSNALIQPSLGRPLSGGAANVTINLVEPGKLYGDRISNLDFRVAKIIRFGTRRVMAGLDLYNVLNSDIVLSQDQTFGPTWLRPQTLIQARFAKFSMQFDF